MTAFVIAGAAVVIVAMLCATALAAWRGWLAALKLEIASRSGGDGEETGLRIELADVRERLRRLEAIANGVDL